jgi:hypothetical protein
MDVGPQKAGPADSPVLRQTAMNNFSCQNIFRGANLPRAGNHPLSPRCSKKIVQMQRNLGGEGGISWVFNSEGE